MPHSSTQPAPSASDLIPVFLRLPSVIRVTGLGRSTIYRLMAEQKFPCPVRLGPRAVAWRRSEIEAWSDARPLASH
jgi:prophage regulatory protein